MATVHEVSQELSRTPASKETIQYTKQQLHSLDSDKFTVCHNIRQKLFKLRLWHQLAYKRKKPSHIINKNKSSLITILPTKTLPITKANTSKCVTFCTVNAGSVRNKASLLHDQLVSTDIDICTITETWLKPEDNKIRAEITPIGYVFRDCPRGSRPGGGTGIVCKSSFTPQLTRSGELHSFEHSEWILNIGKRPTQLNVIYRPPYSVKHPVSSSTFLQEFAEYLEAAVSTSHHLIISGDFNLPGPVEARQLSDLLSSFGLMNIVDFPTHEGGNILDLIITRTSDQHVKNVHSGEQLSDHIFVNAEIIAAKTGFAEKTISYRKLKQINCNDFAKDLQQSQLYSNSYTDPNELAVDYNGMLTSLIDKHAPLRIKVIVDRPKQPWFTEELLQLKREKRNAERLLNRKRSQSGRSAVIDRWFKDLRNEY